ncbi:MAG: S8 family serine peptidase [Bacteroidales bacterium]|nr:S8 family serine peptidase [Bacteroidales bacterium]
MRYIYILLLVWALSAQSQTTGYYFVAFKDKAYNTYSLNVPSAFLSQRALDRRTRQQIIIDSLDLPVSDNYINQLTALGFNIHSKSKWLNGVIVILNNSTDFNTIQTLQFVKSIKYLRPLNPVKSKIEKFEVATKQYNYGYAANQIEMMNGQYLHNLGKKGEGMLIAVLDAGFIGVDTIRYFDSLHVQNRIVLTRDIVDGYNDSYVYESHPHGTMVLSTMVVLRNNEFVGTSPKASYALIRTEEGAHEYILEEYAWVIGAELADSIGADVINSSLGYTTFDDSTMNHTWADLTGRVAVSSIAATICARKGMIVCVSAGNSGDDIWRKIGSPADADSVLTVGAVDANRNYAYFSSQGYSADGRVKPDVSAQGLSSAIIREDGTLTFGSGTSFSSPILCGLVTCLWQANPQKNNMEIIEAVRKSASQYNTPDSLLGYGIPNFELANHILAGIDANFQNNWLVKSVYPNPCEQGVTINYSSPVYTQVQISMFSVDGKLVYQLFPWFELTNEGSLYIPMSAFDKGYYWFEIYSNEAKVVIPVVKK